MIKINCLDLYKKQYTLPTIYTNKNNTTHAKIICAKYILNDDYCTCTEDEDLINYIRHQPRQN